MWNLRRLGILLIITLGVVVPLLAIFVISSEQHGPLAFTQPDRPAASQPASPAAPGGSLGLPVGRASSAPTPVTTGTPLQVAGDGQMVWIAQPGKLAADADSTFALLYHPANQKQDGRDLWKPLQIRGDRRIVGTARGLAVVGGTGKALPPGAYVILQGNLPLVFDGTSKRELPRLPGDLMPVNLAGSAQGLWALAHGYVNETPTAGGPAATTPATTATAPAPATAMAPTSGAPGVSTTPRPGEAWIVQALDMGGWQALPIPGRVGNADVPGADARPILLATASHLLLAWVDPLGPALRSRTLELPAGKDWGPVQTMPLPEPWPVPADPAVILGTVVSDQPYLFYVADSGSGLALAGGPLESDGRVARPLTLELGVVSAGLDPARDVGLALESNSLAVVLQQHDKDRTLQTLLFALDGQQLAGPSPIQPVLTTLPDTQFFQNIGIILIAGLLAMALWMRQRRPAVVRIPKDQRIALVWQRAAAGLIDLAIPVLAVAFVFKLSELAQWRELLRVWFNGASAPEQYLKRPELLWIIGGYTGLSLLAELFSGRTLGKSILGLRVVMLDNTRPTPAAIVMRNLARLPELLLPLLMLFMMISALRQRIGDVLAHTLVVEQGVVGEPRDTTTTVTGRSSAAEPGADTGAADEDERAEDDTTSGRHG